MIKFDRKNVLITGGSGFLGRHLAMALAPKCNVIIGGRNHTLIQYASNVTSCISIPLDVRSKDSISNALRIYQPEIIIHAAATKFVQQSEASPDECIETNIIGSQNLAHLASEHNVQVVIGISTDKAAAPVGSIYGHTKSIMERYFISLDAVFETNLLCVRFGNIAWSSGSVLPVWKLMTESDGIVRTSGLGMYRYMFGVDDAVQLVLDAIDIAADMHGTVISSPMEVVPISDLLDAWCEIYRTNYIQCERRLGDKVHEVLIAESELVYSRTFNHNGRLLYAIDYSQLSTKPISKQICTATSPVMSTSCIHKLINNTPAKIF